MNKIFFTLPLICLLLACTTGGSTFSEKEFTNTIQLSHNGVKEGLLKQNLSIHNNYNSSLGIYPKLATVFYRSFFLRILIFISIIDILYYFVMSFIDLSTNYPLTPKGV